VLWIEAGAAVFRWQSDMSRKTYFIANEQLRQQLPREHLEVIGNRAESLNRFLHANRRLMSFLRQI
jgi:hypothetical protein